MTKKELKEIIKEDKELYFKNENISKQIFHRLTKSFSYEIGKYIITSRKVGYYKEKKRNVLDNILFIYYARKKNNIGKKVNIELAPSFFGRRLKIWHGNVIVNYKTKIGNDCQFHGNNCVGVGKYGKCPVIGDNVDIGVGANIVGDAFIPNGTIIGANSFVNKKFYDNNIVIAGVPAKKIKEGNA